MRSSLYLNKTKTMCVLFEWIIQNMEEYDFEVSLISSTVSI